MIAVAQSALASRAAISGMACLSFAFRAHDYARRSSSAATAVRRERSAFSQSVWEQAAAAVGATVTRLGGPLMEIRCKDARLLVNDNVTSLDDPVTLDIAGNKPLVHRLLTQESIPVPRHIDCPRHALAVARGFLATVDGACVVKPALAGSAGAGITTGVRGLPNLVSAMARAGAYSRDVLIEEQVYGDNYRLLYLDGDLLDAVIRRPPTAVGDGRSTIRQLVAAENARRVKKGADAAHSLLTTDQDLRNTLRAQGYRLTSVPPAHTMVRLKTAVSENRRDENEAASERMCASIVQSGSLAARTLGARLAGVDVITKDPGVPLSDSGGVVLEVNTTPSFFYHYTSAGGGGVAESVLRRLSQAVE